MVEELKEQVCEANRSLSQLRLVTFTWGNVSGIDRAQNLVVIKPSGVDYAKLLGDDMVVVALDDGRVVDGQLRPSSDTPTHLALYRAFPTIGGIAHTHSTYATIFSQACRAIPALGTTHADNFRGEVPVTRPLFKKEVEVDYEHNTGVVIIDRFARLSPVDVPGVLVANHGPFTWGATAQDAIQNSIILEEVAHMAYGTLTLHPQMMSLPPYLVDKHYMRKHGPHATYGQEAGH